jgi:capsular polysaccharide biosynthesis protein
MELAEYWRVLRRRAWIPIALTVLAAVGASVLTFLSKPEYTATATVLAKAPSGGTTITFTEIATSNSLALRIQKKLNLQEGVDQILSQIRVSPSSSADTFKVSVSDIDAKRAANIANAAATEAVALYQDKVAPTRTSIAALDGPRTEFRNLYLAAVQALIEYRRAHPNTSSADAQLMLLQLDVQAAGDSYIRLEQAIAQLQITAATDPSTSLASVLDEAAPMPDTTARLLRIVYAAGLAVVLGIGLILGLEYFDHSVRSPEEAEQLVGAPVLGVIPRARLRSLRQARSGVL